MKNQLLFILLAIGLLSCYDEPSAPLKEIIKGIQPTRSAIPANGVDTTKITVELPDNTAPDRRMVSFTTTKGLFVETEKNAATVKAEFNSANKLLATVYLRSTTLVERAIITAQILDRKDTTSVRFSRAYPNTIVIRSDKLVIQPRFASEVTFTIEQKRSPGQVSLNTVASLTVIGSDNKSRGRFRNPQPESDANGKSTFIYTLGIDSTYTGPLRAVAMVWDSTSKKAIPDTLLFYSIQSK